MRLLSVLIVGCVFTVSLAPTGNAGGHPSTHHTAKMNGANVVPSGAGDPDGTGTLKLTLAPDRRNNRICWVFTYNNVGTPTQLWIRRGKKGEECLPLGCGDKFTAESLQFSGFSSGGKFCKFQDKKDVLYYQRHITGYYAELRTSDFPDGAIRGQLR